jgi:hypothetical protein
VIEFPPYRLDTRAGRLWHGDRLVELRPKAWALLRHLAERPGALVTKEELHAAVWGDEQDLAQHGGDDEEVHGDEGLKVVLEKDSPGLRWRRSMADGVRGDRCL